MRPKRVTFRTKNKTVPKKSRHECNISSYNNKMTGRTPLNSQIITNLLMLIEVEYWNFKAKSLHFFFFFLSSALQSETIRRKLARTIQLYKKSIIHYTSSRKLYKINSRGRRETNWNWWRKTRRRWQSGGVEAGGFALKIAEYYFIIWINKWEKKGEKNKLSQSIILWLQFYLLKLYP